MAGGFGQRSKHWFGLSYDPRLLLAGHWGQHKMKMKVAAPARPVWVHPDLDSAGPRLVPEPPGRPRQAAQHGCHLRRREVRQHADMLSRHQGQRAGSAVCAPLHQHEGSLFVPNVLVELDDLTPAATAQNAHTLRHRCKLLYLFSPVQHLINKSEHSQCWHHHSRHPSLRTAASVPEVSGTADPRSKLRRGRS